MKKKRQIQRRKNVKEEETKEASYILSVNAFLEEHGCTPVTSSKLTAAISISTAFPTVLFKKWNAM